ncbi:MAG: hypothetical protein MI922_10500, partial [Bacteroidales bacterium]|nr:hypothetical protein [Bacteroidales bacterium]
MKTLITTVLISLAFVINAQSYNQPESMVFDANNDRYFVSNKKGNTIVILKDGKLTDFVTTGLNGPKGLLIHDNTLITINNTFVAGYKLSDGSLEF